MSSCCFRPRSFFIGAIFHNFASGSSLTCCALFSKDLTNGLSKSDYEVVECHKQAEQNNRDSYKDPATKYLVFTKSFHLRRGKCCGSACRHVRMFSTQYCI